MHHTHIRFKPTKKISVDFDVVDEAIKGIEISKENKDFQNEYFSSEKLLDEYEKDVYLFFEKGIVYGFDYLHKKNKILIPEINPVTIFYSNALMSLRKLNILRDLLFINSPKVNDFQQKNVNTDYFGNFFQLASNSIINLQATLECFANRIIPVDYLYIDKYGNPTNDTITFKLYNVIPKIKKIDFNNSKARRKYNRSIDKLIKLRNELVHLKPADLNSGYKKVYRELLKYDYDQALISVKEYINFYEADLIEECSCGKEHYFDTLYIDRKQKL